MGFDEMVSKEGKDVIKLVTREGKNLHAIPSYSYNSRHCFEGLEDRKNTP
jgi:hypothetical protein